MIACKASRFICHPFSSFDYNDYRMLLVLAVIPFFLCIGGCKGHNESVSLQNQKINASSLSKTTVVDSEIVVESQNKDISQLTQCNRDLESLRTVSQTEYRRYAAEYDALLKSSAGFMTVKDDVSPEVAALARPKFQFALVNLCYRIKDALARTLINQAGGR